MKREAVRPSNGRDTWLKRLMPKDGMAAGPCLDAETFAAWTEGALSGKALAAAEQHVSECSRCLALAAAMQRTTPQPVQSAPDRRALWRWIVPLTAAATAVAIWITVLQPEQRRQEKQQSANALQQEPKSAAPSSVPLPSGGMAGGPAPPTPEAARDELRPQARATESPRARRDADEVRFRNEADLKRKADLKKEEDVERERQAAELPGALAETVTLTDPNAPAAPPSAAPAPPASPQLGAANAKQAEADTFTNDRLALGRSVDKPNIIEAAATDRRIRWRVINGTEIERTTDGGQTWLKTSKPPARVVSIRDVDAVRATITISSGSTFTTTDGGATWAVQEKPAAPF
jgi:hypothetical protein